MGKPKAPKAPPPPPPIAPAPTVQESEPAAEETMRRTRRRSGFQKTILTGSLTPGTGKKTVLG